jgi:hypothetical protein
VEKIVAKPHGVVSSGGAPMKVRLIEESDMENLLEAERQFNRTQVEDPDFGSVEWLNPWTMSAEDILAVIRQRPEKNGRERTRTERPPR